MRKQSTLKALAMAPFTLGLWINISGMVSIGLALKMLTSSLGYPWLTHFMDLRILCITAYMYTAETMTEKNPE